MSWRERLQPGSFRGIPFSVEQASGKGGRRVALHQYPQQEQHWAEDLGKAAETERLQIFVVGADYDQARDELFKALKAPGPGTLVHPYLGTRHIQVMDYDWTISTRKGGFCQITVEYVRAGKRQYPADSQANAQALQTACNGAATAVQDSFAEQFTVSGSPQFVQQAAINQLTAAIDTLRQLYGQIASAMQPLNNLDSQIDQFSDELSTLTLQPRSLAVQAAGVVVAVVDGSNDISTAFDGYNSLLAGFRVSDPVPQTTPSRKRQATNQTVINNLLLGMATIETARFVAQGRAPYTTYNQAITSRDLLLQELDSLIDNGTDAEYTALADLQSAIVRRVDDVAPGLQRVEQIQLQQTVPALVLAHQLYGNADRADEVVSRNQVTHPLFMPAGTDLEVLS